MGAFNSLGIPHPQQDKDIILFDGVCNLCNGAINFILDRDDHQRFVFASLQSDLAISLLQQNHYTSDRLSSIIVFTKQGQLLNKSDAALYIAKHLSGGWKHITILRFVPRFIRDTVYNIIARYRYSIFGKQDQCRIPTPALRQRFLDA